MGFLIFLLIAGGIGTFAYFMIKNQNANDAAEQAKFESVISNKGPPKNN